MEAIQEKELLRGGPEMAISTVEKKIRKSSDHFSIHNFIHDCGKHISENLFF